MLVDGISGTIPMVLAVRLPRLLVYMGGGFVNGGCCVKGVGKMQINDVLMWHVFDLQDILHATCPSSG